MKSHKLAAIFLAVFAVAAQAATYVITSSGETFTVKKDGEVLDVSSTSLWNPIQDIINAIGVDISNSSAGENTIQFGNNTDVLDIGTGRIEFNRDITDNSMRWIRINWGAITLAGKITSAAEDGAATTIYLYDDNAIITSTAEITNTAEGGTAIRASRNLTISGGKVSATGANSTAIRSGKVTISGGEVSATGTNSFAIDQSAVTLTGTPIITGKINVSTSVEVKLPTSSFIPGSNKYNIEFSDIQGNVAVRNGAKFRDSFIFTSILNDINLNFSPTANAAKDGSITVTTSNGYAVSKSGTTYTITKGSGGTYIAAQQAIDNIQTQANGTASTIQFGNGSVLNIGNGDLSFSYDDDGNEVPWSGAITLNGKISANSITLNNVSATSTADITARIENNSGTLNISGGTIEGYINNCGGKDYSWDDVHGTEVVTERIGILNISAGTINGQVSNNDGILNISGGTINGSVYSSHFDIRTSKTTVSGTAKIIAPDDYAAVRIVGSEEWTGEAFRMTGGTILAKNEYAVCKNSSYFSGTSSYFSGTASITGGTLFAYRKVHYNDSYEPISVPMGAIDVISDNITVGSGTTILAWDKNAGTTTYTSFSTTDIFKSVGTANWLIKNGAKGIAYANGANTGFIELHVTMNKATPTITWPTAAAITYGSPLSSSALTGGNSNGVAGTFAWVNPTTKPNAGNTAKYNVNFSPADPENYTALSYATAITVNKANGLIATAPHTLMIKNTDESEKTFDLADIALNKDDYGTLDYLNEELTDASSILAAEYPKIESTSLKYKGSGESEGTATQKIKITSTNYTDVDVPITFKATYKTEVPITNLTVANSTYDGTAKRGVIGTASSGEFDRALVWEYAGTGIAGTSTTQPRNAGSYVLTVSVPDDDETYFGSAFYKFSIEKATGATIAAALTASKTANSITVSAAAPTNGQTLEYAISSTSTATVPTDGWQTSATFSNLIPLTQYYVFARAAANNNYNAGTASTGLSVTTDAASSSTPPVQPVTPPVAGGGSGSGSTSGSGAGINLSDSPKVTPIFKTETPAIVNIAVKTSTNAILLSNLPSNAKVEVYNMQGKRIYSAYPENPKILRIGVQTGIYIVKVNSQTMKIAVR